MQKTAKYINRFIKRPIKRSIQKVLHIPDPWQDIQRLTVNRKPGIIVDVGANKGQTAVKLSALLPEWKIYAFEPFPETFKKLEEVVSSLPNVIPFNIAISNKTGTADFHVNASNVTNSLLPATNSGMSYFPEELNLQGIIQVCTKTLDDWSKEANIHDIRILKMDVQGSELLVLEGATELLLNSVQLVFSEVQFLPIYEDSATFGRVEAFLLDRGFYLYQLYDLHSGPDGQLLYGDALFIKKGDGSIFYRVN
ncbi:MAG: FkbM family methyltransferase [bacterium]